MIDILLATLFIIICVLLIVVVLLQKGRGGGLSAAFGGAGSSAFGTRVGDVFTWVTIVLVALFLLLAIGTTMWFRPPRRQVLIPVFTPPVTSSNEAEMVTIACETKDARIHYTTDGSDPDERSTEYRNAVRVEPGTMLKARAYRVGWDPSVIRVGYYGPPAVEPVISPVPVEPVEIPATGPAGEGPPTTQPAAVTTPAAAD